MRDATCEPDEATDEVPLLDGGQGRSASELAALARALAEVVAIAAAALALIWLVS